MSEIDYKPWTAVRILGKGAAGTVYEIKREESGKKYRAALKVVSIPDEDEWKTDTANGMNESNIVSYYKSCVEQLTNEFAILAKLKGDTNIVGYEDHKVIPHRSRAGWDVYIRMELLTPLPVYLSKADLSRNQVVKMGIDLCQVLRLCEKNHIIHRDIKPDHIFISSEGDFKLGGFETAKVTSGTLANMSRMGTPDYMAPELYKGESYNHTADIYSLGMVLYQLMNKKHIPFTSNSSNIREREAALGKRISGEKLPVPENCDFPLASIILKACAYRPEDRYQSADDMLRDLKFLLNGQTPDPLDRNGLLSETEEVEKSALQDKTEPAAFDADATFLGESRKSRITGRVHVREHPVYSENSSHDEETPIQHISFDNIRNYDYEDPNSEWSADNKRATYDRRIHHDAADKKKPGSNSRPAEGSSTKIIVAIIAAAAAVICVIIFSSGTGRRLIESRVSGRTDKDGKLTESQEAADTFQSGRIDTKARNTYINDFLDIQIETSAGWTGKLGDKDDMESDLISEGGYDDFSASSGDGLKQLDVCVKEHDAAFTENDIADTTDQESVNNLVASYDEDDFYSQAQAERTKKVLIAGKTYTAVTITGKLSSDNSYAPFWHVYCIGGTGRYEIQITLASFGENSTAELTNMISKPA